MVNQNPIVVSQKFDASPEKVWNAITRLEEMQIWYFPMIPEFRPEVGFETQFLIQNEGWNFTHIWRVKEVIRQEIIGYTWNFEEYAGEGYTIFELNMEGNETILTLKSYVRQPFPDDIPEFKRESGQAGWDYLIKKSLHDYLKKG